MTILLHKSYLVKVTTKGEGSQNTQKFDHVIYGCPHVLYVASVAWHTRQMVMVHVPNEIQMTRSYSD